MFILKCRDRLLGISSHISKFLDVCREDEKIFSPHRLLEQELVWAANGEVAVDYNTKTPATIWIVGEVIKFIFERDGEPTDNVTIWIKPLNDKDLPALVKILGDFKMPSGGEQKTDTMEFR